MKHNNLLIDKLFPITTSVNADDTLTIGNLNIHELARKFGTPLYIYDYETIKKIYNDFYNAFEMQYGEVDILYASKVFLNLPFAKLLHKLGVKFDVVSHGEMSMLIAAKIGLENAYFHGNNKTVEELGLAIKNNIGAIVIDNIEEIQIINEIAKNINIKQNVLVRVTPNIDPFTHEKTTTGLKDSKFGLSIEDRSAEDAISLISESSNISFRGIHAHLGSPINITDPYVKAIDKMFSFIKNICLDKYSLNVSEFSPGGGFGVVSEPDMDTPTIEEFAIAISNAIKFNCKKYGIDLPKMFIEPGRSLLARSAVSVYKVGTRKEIPNVRTYVSVDGGMADNIRPTLYDAKYYAIPVKDVYRKPEEIVTISGKYCESGDYLIKDIHLPKLTRDELIAMPMSGAYQLAMASNYNLAYKPAVILVHNNKSTLIRRRESISDIISLDEDIINIP
ncbi:MAG: diaminopimelate decarboxylase [Chloroflexi bacterium]|jgi:diaminopimelate decarboxylase|nr:MAG: diaminopimelate decarboxylase [Chloroflexota bacterium]|tara:strand:+ start:6016 stop:7359 length:1344 start_codon:yes stop_codon:yes gene_type:complete